MPGWFLVLLLLITAFLVLVVFGMVMRRRDDEVNGQIRAFRAQRRALNPHRRQQ
jgi:hypothetical protein